MGPISPGRSSPLVDMGLRLRKAREFLVVIEGIEIHLFQVFLILVYAFSVVSMVVRNVKIRWYRISKARGGRQRS